MFTGGLIALIFNTALCAEFVHSNNLIANSSFEAEVEKLGVELEQKTGVSLKLVILKNLPDSSIVNCENQLLKKFTKPTILLIFCESPKMVDIATNDTSLYTLFDKKQVLAPTASAVQAFMLALFYSHDFDSFKEMASDYGGTIVPLLAQKSKDEELHGKYAGALFNGYADIAHQVATTKGTELENDVGNANQNSIFVVKIVFYGFIVYALVMFIRRKFVSKK